MLVQYFYTCFLSNGFKQVFSGFCWVCFVAAFFKLLIASYPKLLAKGWAKQTSF